MKNEPIKTEFCPWFAKKTLRGKVYVQVVSKESSKDLSSSEIDLPSHPGRWLFSNK